MNRSDESGERKEGNENDGKSCRIWDCGSPLYDAYELVAVSHIVERHFMILPHLSGSRVVAGSCHEVVSCSEKAVETTSSENGRRSSVLGFFSRSSMWKRKIDGGEVNQKAKKQKTGISKFFAWKK